MLPPALPILPSIRQLLHRDRVVAASGLVFGLSIVALAWERFNPLGVAGQAAELVDPVLLTTTLVVLLLGRRRVGNRRERRFWDLLALAWACWLAVEFFYFSGLSLPLLSASFATDALHILYYLIFALAIDLRPHVEPPQSLTLLRRRLESVAALLAFFGVLIYFALVVLPEPLGLSLSIVSRQQGLTPFLLLRISLDLFILGRLSYAAFTSSGKWPRVFGLLASSLALLALRDGLAVLHYEGLAVLEWLGSAHDLLLTLPGFLVVLAARLRFVPTAESAERGPGRSARDAEREWQLSGLVAVYTLVVPLVHCLVYPLGLFTPESRDAHAVFALIYMLVVGSVAVAHQVLLNRERRQAAESLRQEIEERRRMNRELELRHAEMEQFTYTISHELQTPLVTIGGFVGLLEKSLERNDHEQLEQDLDKIRAAASRMRQTLLDLLELSRVGWLVSPVDDMEMSEVVAEACARLQDKTGPQEPLITVEPDLPAVSGDAARMVDVLTNLIDNAVKFTPLGKQPEIRIGCRPGAVPVFYVADNGRGIQPRFHDRVFGLFDRLDPAVEGTGIGLALVKRIIEEHGGKVWVESAGDGQGATFCFTLAGSRPAR